MKKDDIPFFVALLVGPPFISLLIGSYKGAIFYICIFAVAVIISLVIEKVQNSDDDLQISEKKKIKPKPAYVLPKDAQTARNDAYSQLVFEFHGMANPFEYAGTDKPYFIFHGGGYVSMMIDTLIEDPNINRVHEKWIKPYCVPGSPLQIGRSSLSVLKRIYVLHLDDKTGGFKTIIDSTQRADLLLYIFFNKWGQIAIWYTDISNCFDIDHAIKWADWYTKEMNCPIYAILGAKDEGTYDWC